VAPGKLLTPEAEASRMSDGNREEILKFQNPNVK